MTVSPPNPQTGRAVERSRRARRQDRFRAGAEGSGCTLGMR